MYARGGACANKTNKYYMYTENKLGITALNVDKFIIPMRDD